MRRYTTIKRLLAVHGCPPDAAEEAIRRVLLQTKTLAEERLAWALG
ncbi:hypothetical protein ABZ541_21585 [Micromonospora sediminicola]